ncbi:MAG: pitrilysin family protein [Pseudomonadota bacterium]
MRVLSYLCLLPWLTFNSAFAAETLTVSLPYEEFRLDNGLRVIVHEDRKAPIVAVQVMYDVGSKDELLGKTGFAHLFEHLMFNGSENFDRDFFVALKDMGATQYNGTTNTDRTNYYQTVPRVALEQILFLESDRMGHLLGAVTQEKLDNQIGVVKNEKRLGEDRPFGRRIWSEIFENLYPVGHPYHHSTIGSMEDIGNATLDDVNAWFRQYYGAANATIVLAGDVSVGDARPLMNKYFGHIPSGPPLLKAKSNSVPLAENKSGVFYDRVAQPRLYRAYVAPPTGDAVSPLLDLMTRVLAGGKTSRLHKRLVDDRQIANGVSAFYLEAKLSGQIMFMVDAKSEEVLEEIDAILNEEIAHFLRKGLTRGELERAKTTYLASEVRGLEAVAGKAATLARGAVLLDDPDFYVDENLNRMQAATSNEVKEAGAAVLTHGYFALRVLPFPAYKTGEDGYDRANGLPERGEVGSANFPVITEKTLSNGIRVVIAPRPTVPVVELGIQFDAGIATDNIPIGARSTALPGLADMAVNLLEEGTRTLDAQQIAEQAEAIGARISVYNTRDDSKAYLSALTVHLGESLDLLADILKNASYPEEEIEKFRQQLIDGLLQEKADVNALGRRALQAALYGPDHPYGAAEKIDDAIKNVEAISRDDLIGWRDAWLRPEGATLFVSGDVEVQEIMPMLEAAFGTWTGRGEVLSKSLPTRQNPTSSRLIVIDKPGTQQSLIMAGRLIGPSGTDKDTAFAAMNDSFGGNFLSRINMNIREDKGWSYGVRSGMALAAGQRIFTIQAPVQGDKTGASISELKKEMDQVRGNRPLTQEELSQTVASIVGAAPGEFETARSVLFSMMTNNTYGRPLDYAVGRTDRYRKLALTDLAVAVEEVINPEDLTWVIVGDWDMIEEQVRGLNMGPITVRTVDE